MALRVSNQGRAKKTANKADSVELITCQIEMRNMT